MYVLLPAHLIHTWYVGKLITTATATTTSLNKHKSLLKT